MQMSTLGIATLGTVPCVLRRYVRPEKPPRDHAAFPSVRFGRRVRWPRLSAEWFALSC